MYFTNTIPVTGDCGHTFQAEVVQYLDTDEQELVAELLTGMINFVDCPVCRTLTNVRVPILYHDLPRKLAVLLYDRERDPNPEASVDAVFLYACKSAGSRVLFADLDFGAEGIRGLEDQTLIAKISAVHPDWGHSETYGEVFRLKQSECQDRFNALMNALSITENYDSATEEPNDRDETKAQRPHRYKTKRRRISRENSHCTVRHKQRTGL
jgi:hypothetical protein